MANYKMQSAEKALQFIKPGLCIGLGDGTTVRYLTELIVADKELALSITFTTSSVKTASQLKSLGIKVQPLSDLSKVDIYFDGCDQFDRELNALKSGSGIHTLEKILANMAAEFILMGDADKFSAQLTTQYPLVIEVLPLALNSVIATLQITFADAELKLRQKNNEDSPAITDHGNYLLEVRFDNLPDLATLNTFIKMLPGVLNHSLFYRMATKAIISGINGTEILEPQYF
jgi:ribose 5-phosphate isomerase A